MSRSALTTYRRPPCIRHLRGLLLLAGITTATSGGPRAVVAQEVDDDRSIPAFVEFHLGVTRLAEVSAGQAGMAALLDVGPLRLGGGVWGVLRRIDEGPVLGGSGLDLTLGYGGALVEYPLPGSPFSLRLLAGGGAATLRTLAVGARFDTETFAVLEPATSVTIPLLPSVALGGLVGYRWVRGADALFLAGNADLSGAHGTVFLRIGGR